MPGEWSRWLAPLVVEEDEVGPGGDHDVDKRYAGTENGSTYACSTMLMSGVSAWCCRPASRRDSAGGDAKDGGLISEGALDAENRRATNRIKSRSWRLRRAMPWRWRMPSTAPTETWEPKSSRQRSATWWRESRNPRRGVAMAP
jgi:hypothetical protein